MTCTVWTPNTYPPARRSDHVDIYRSEAKGQVRVPDPYQWLEEYTTETDEWTSAQEAFTRAYLDKNPEGVRLEQAFRASTDYAKVCTRHPNSCSASYNTIRTVLCACTLRRRPLVLVPQHRLTGAIRQVRF